jgi:thiamine biosynthesis lipoprotein
MTVAAGRRQFLGQLAWGVGGTLLAFRAPASAAPADERTVVLGRPLLGTIIEAEADHPDLVVARRALEAGFARITDVDRLMSTFRPDSEISVIGRQAGRTPVPISPETRDVLAEAVGVGAQSAGALDVTVHPLVRLWSAAALQGRLPSRMELDRTLVLLGPAQLALDEGRCTARLARRGAGIDLGGIAKGYAVDAAVDALRAGGVRRGIVNAGGDLRVFGLARGGEPWRIGIRHPLRPASLLATVLIEDGAVATSGNYFRFVTIQGREYGHLLSPRTGFPAVGGLSATVLGPRAVRADALATAALVSGPGGAMELLARAGADGLVVERAARGAARGGVTVHATRGLKDRVTLLDRAAVLDA